MLNLGLLLRACQNVVKPRCIVIHLVWRQACLSVVCWRKLTGVRHACTYAGPSITPSLMSFICPHRTKPVWHKLLLTSHKFLPGEGGRSLDQSHTLSVCTESKVMFSSMALSHHACVCQASTLESETVSERKRSSERERKLLAVSSTTQQAFSTFVPLKHGCYSKSLRVIIFSSQIWL